MQAFGNGWPLKTLKEMGSEDIREKRSQTEAKTEKNKTNVCKSAKERKRTPTPTCAMGLSAGGQAHAGILHSSRRLLDRVYPHLKQGTNGIGPMGPRKRGLAGGSCCDFALRCSHGTGEWIDAAPLRRRSHSRVFGIPIYALVAVQRSWRQVPIEEVPMSSPFVARESQRRVPEVWERSFCGLRVDAWTFLWHAAACPFFLSSFFSRSAGRQPGFRPCLNLQWPARPLVSPKMQLTTRVSDPPQSDFKRGSDSRFLLGTPPSVSA